MRYKVQTGSLAWIIHRATGIALTLYIFLHLYILSHLSDPAEYTSIMRIMRQPLTRLSEAGLLGLVVAHALNGIRLTLLELGFSTGLQKKIFWSAFSFGALIFVYGGWIIVGGRL